MALRFISTWKNPDAQVDEFTLFDQEPDPTAKTSVVAYASPPEPHGWRANRFPSLSPRPSGRHPND
jgi:hypothetical protein